MTQLHSSLGWIRSWNNNSWSQGWSLSRVSQTIVAAAIKTTQTVSRTVHIRHSNRPALIDCSSTVVRKNCGCWTLSRRKNWSNSWSSMMNSWSNSWSNCWSSMMMVSRSIHSNDSIISDSDDWRLLISSRVVSSRSWSRSYEWSGLSHCSWLLLEDWRHLLLKQVRLLLMLLKEKIRLTLQRVELDLVMLLSS